MKKNTKQGILLYRISDFFSAMLSWFVFFIYRKYNESGALDWENILQDNKLHLGLILIPVFWVTLYTLFDKYKDLHRYSRIDVLRKTMTISFFGSLIIYFILLIDDNTKGPTDYFYSFARLFLIHFIITSFIRMIILTRANKRLRSGKVAYNTIIIGGDQNGVDLYKEIISKPYSLGHNFIGFIDSNGNSSNHLKEYLPKLGKINDLRSIIEQKEIEEVIIAVETSEHSKLKGLFDTLFDYSEQLLIKVIPDMYDIILGNVKMNHVYGAVLIEVEQDLMPQHEKTIKRIMDIVCSAIALVILSPLILFIMLRVKLSSRGPIFFKQERVGYQGKPFNIIKFRSMYVNAEEQGPQLSNDDDPRVTKWGKIMRKYRLDEIPQFWNVLKGEMSLVGPRPERQYFIDKLLQRAPHYKHLLKVRPGITSWGQVKYGYASDIDQMLQRMKFDILYIENMSLSLDLKILVYTIMVLIKGKGK